MHVILFSLCYALSARHFPPSRDCGPPLHFVLVFAFSSRLPPLRKGFDVGFPCHSACVLLQLVFLRLAPPATLAVRGGFLTVVCLIIAPFFVPPPATLAVRGRFLTVVCLIIVPAFPSITCLRVLPGFIAKPFRGVGVGFEEPHLRLMF